MELNAHCQLVLILFLWVLTLRNVCVSDIFLVYIATIRGGMGDQMFPKFRHFHKGEGGGSAPCEDFFGGQNQWTDLILQKFHRIRNL